MWPPNPPAGSDAANFDRAMDDLAVGDPYATTWEPQFGSVHVAVIAATQASDLSAGSYPADAHATNPPPVSRGRTGLSDL